MFCVFKNKKKSLSEEKESFDCELENYKERKKFEIDKEIENYRISQNVIKANIARVIYEQISDHHKSFYESKANLETDIARLEAKKEYLTEVVEMAAEYFTIIVSKKDAEIERLNKIIFEIIDLKK